MATKNHLMAVNNKLDDNFMMQTMDMRRFFLCLFKKLWILVLSIILGAILGVGFYKLYYAITDGQTKYQISNDYYIVFNEADYPHGMDYYNAYTWGQFAVDDKIVDYALSKVEGAVTKEDIKSSVTTLMLSDYRVLSVIVTNTDIDKMNAISEAYKLAMPYFANQVNELTSIELWSCDEMQIANVHNRTINAAILGAIIALVIFGFSWSIYYCLDDRIYVENDWNKNGFGIPLIGYNCKMFAEDTEANKQAIVNKSEDGIVMEIPMGKKHSTEIAYELGVMNKQGKKVMGALITDCDEKFLKCYYGRK